MRSMGIPAEVMAKHNLVVDVPGWKQFILEDYRSFISYGLEANVCYAASFVARQCATFVPSVPPSSHRFVALHK